MEPEDAAIYQPATSEDVAAALLRPLTQQEKTYVEYLLGRAERAIRRAFTDKMAVEPDCGWDTVRDVQAEMVARRLRNPSGMMKENDGEYSYELDRGVASGRLELTPEDLADLGLAGSDWLVGNPILEYDRKYLRGVVP